MIDTRQPRARYTMHGTRCHALYRNDCYDRLAICGICCSGPLSGEPFDPEDPGACKSCARILAKQREMQGGAE